MVRPHDPDRSSLVRHRSGSGRIRADRLGPDRPGDSGRIRDGSGRSHPDWGHRGGSGKEVHQGGAPETAEGHQDEVPGRVAGHQDEVPGRVADCRGGEPATVADRRGAGVDREVPVGWAAALDLPERRDAGRRGHPGVHHAHVDPNRAGDIRAWKGQSNQSSRRASARPLGAAVPATRLRESAREEAVESRILALALAPRDWLPRPGPGRESGEARAWIPPVHELVRGARVPRIVKRRAAQEQGAAGQALVPVEWPWGQAPRWQREPRAWKASQVRAPVRYEPPGQGRRDVRVRGRPEELAALQEPLLRAHPHSPVPRDPPNNRNRQHFRPSAHREPG